VTAKTPPVTAKTPPAKTPSTTAHPQGTTKAGKHPTVKGKAGQQSNRRAHLRITNVDVLSILKMSFLFAFCTGIVIFTALFMLWGILVSSGAVESAQSLLNSVMGNPNGTTTVNLAQYLSAQRVVGFVTLISAVEVVVMTILGFLFGLLYNLAAVMFGGLEVTLEV